MNYAKIVHIITRLDKGGSADIVLQLSEELKNRGYETVLVSGLTMHPTANLKDFVERTGVQLKFIPYLQRDINVLNDFKSLYFIIKFLMKEKPLIVHVHSSKAGFIGRIAARLTGVKCIVYSTHGHIFYGYFNNLSTWIFIQMERLAACFGDTIATLTEIEKREFCSLKIAKESKIRPVTNGLNRALTFSSPQGQFRSELGLDDKAFLLGWVGRFEPVKGPDIFLSICKRLGDSHIKAKAVMVGDGSLYQEIKRQRSFLGLADFLSLTGHRNDVMSIMQGINVLILTSRNEGLGMVILEAMAAKKPVVAMNVGGVSELVEDGVTGYLVAHNDIGAMISRINHLIENKQDRDLMGKNAYKKARKYSFANMVTQYENIYTTILGSKKCSIQLKKLKES